MLVRFPMGRYGGVWGGVWFLRGIKICGGFDGWVSGEFRSVNQTIFSPKIILGMVVKHLFQRL